MKEFKVAMIVTVITICIILGCSQVCAETSIPYPRLTVVFATEEVDEYQIVKCLDNSRNVWIFYDDNFIWKSGDIANLLLFDYNPEIIEDDEIIDVIWEGYDPSLYDLFIGWR